MGGNEAPEPRRHVGSHRNGLPGGRCINSQPKGGSAGPILLSELGADRVVMAKMAMGFVVTTVDHNRRIDQAPVQRRNDGTHRHDPDGQHRNDTIAHAPFCPPHLLRLDAARVGVNETAVGSGRRAAYIRTGIESLRRCSAAATAGNHESKERNISRRAMLGAKEGLIVGGFLDSQAAALTASDSAPRVVMPARDRLARTIISACRKSAHAARCALTAQSLQPRVAFDSLRPPRQSIRHPRAGRSARFPIGDLS